MTVEAILAVVAFVVLFAAWSLLPSRFLKRRQKEAQVPRAPAPAPPVPAAVPRPAAVRASGVVELKLVRNPAFTHTSPHLPRYFYLVRLNGTSEEARLPVYWDPTPASEDFLVREAYRVRVAGQTLQAGNLQVLGELVRAAVGALVSAGGPPRFWLVHGGRTVPVYRNGGTYEALTDGPRLWGRDLAELRDRYAHYLASCNGGGCGPVTVALFSLADLDVHAPQAALVAPGVWAPAFARQGWLVAFGPGDASWSVPLGPAALLTLWERVAAQLAASGRIAHPCALWAEEVSASCRAELLKASRPVGLALRFVRFDASGARKVSLPVYRAGGVFFAGCEELSCVHAAPDPHTLREFLARHLLDAGVVAGVPEVTLEEEAAHAGRWEAVRAQALVPA